MSINRKKFRTELKYCISIPTYLHIRGILKHALNQDTHMKNRLTYNVKSLYFDDAYDRAFIEKISGVNERRKYRIRIYNNCSDVIKLEKKEKISQFVCKQVSFISSEEYQNIISGTSNFIVQANTPRVLRDFNIEHRTISLKPKVIVDYEREAYTLSDAGVRVTFDTKIRARADCLSLFKVSSSDVQVFNENVVVMELKYNTFIPNIVKSLLSVTRAQAVSVSKYVLCRQRLYNNNFQIKDSIGHVNHLNS